MENNKKGQRDKKKLLEREKYRNFNIRILSTNEKYENSVIVITEERYV